MNPTLKVLRAALDPVPGAQTARAAASTRPAATATGLRVIVPPRKKGGTTAGKPIMRGLGKERQVESPLSVASISTHVLDTERGRPARGVHVALYRAGELVADGETDDDGRIPSLADALEPGAYSLVFHPP